MLIEQTNFVIRQLIQVAILPHESFASAGANHLYDLALKFRWHLLRHIQLVICVERLLILNVVIFDVNFIRNSIISQPGRITLLLLLCYEIHHPTSSRMPPASLFFLVFRKAGRVGDVLKVGGIRRVIRATIIIFRVFGRILLVVIHNLGMVSMLIQTV